MKTSINYPIHAHLPNGLSSRLLTKPALNDSSFIKDLATIAELQLLFRVNVLDVQALQKLSIKL
jgi:hypothetical protein